MPLDDVNDAKLLETWREEGWLHLPGFFDEGSIAEVNRVVESLWTAKPRNVTVDDVDRGHRCRMSDLPDENRTHRIKINDLYLTSEPVRRILLDDRLIDVVASLLGDDPVLCNSLNLEKSSAQDYHADSLYMTPASAEGLVACWIALEDVRPGSGPLRLYPASHRIPRFLFSDGSMHAIAHEVPRFAAYMQNEIDSRGLQPHTVFATSGDLVIWHADLLHGAEPIADSSRTRKSLVSHYFRRADCLRRGDVVERSGRGGWLRRRPQPVDQVTRVLSGVERRIRRVRAVLRDFRRWPRRTRWS